MASITLDDVVLELAEANGKLDVIDGNTDVSGTTLLEIQEGVAQLVMSQQSLYDVLTGNKLLEEEQRREMLKLLSGLGGDENNSSGTGDTNVSGGGSSVLGELGLAAGLAALAGLLTGAVAGYVKGVLDIIKKFTIDPINGMFKRIGKLIDEKIKITPFLDDIKASVVAKFTALKTSLTDLIDEKVKKPFTELMDKIKGKWDELLEPIIKKFDDIKAAITGETGILTKLKTWFSSLWGKDEEAIVDSIKKTIQNPFNKVRNFFSGENSLLKPVTTFLDDLVPFFEKFKSLGSKLGRLFAPIGVVLSVFDGLDEAEDAASKIGEDEPFYKKLMAAVVGFIGGVIDGAIMQLADLIKDGLAWVAGKLGFENIEQQLDEFSFSDKFNEVLDSIYEMINAPLDWFKEKFQAMKAAAIQGLEDMGDFTDKFNEYLREMLRSILPNPAASRTSAEFYLSKVVPDAIYEYAGMDPRTGEVIQRIGAEPVRTGFEMSEMFAAAQQAGINADDLRAQLAAGQQVIIPNYGTVSSNEGGVSVVPIEARTRIYDPQVEEN